MKSNMDRDFASERMPTPRPGSHLRLQGPKRYAMSASSSFLNDENTTLGPSRTSPVPVRGASSSSPLMNARRPPAPSASQYNPYEVEALTDFEENFLTEMYGVTHEDIERLHQERNHPYMVDLRQRLELMYLDQFDNVSIDENFLEALEMSRNPLANVEPKPNYPLGANVVTECLICLDTMQLHKRICCSFPACDSCMNQYLETQVNQGVVKIACISGICKESVHRDEILGRLSNTSKDKYYKFLVDANSDPKIKTCPRCNYIYKLKEHGSQDRGKYGALVSCPDCRLDWCFSCQAPYHVGVKCKDFKKGDKLLKTWANEQHYGRTNAQRCPKCKIFIERKSGCDQMICTQCVTTFCYRCGGRYMDLKFFGNHLSRYSPVGCKYQLLPEKPSLRRFIRGSVFGGQILLGLVLASVGVVAVGTLIGASVVILPAFGAYKYHRHRKLRKRLRYQESLFKRVEVLRENTAAERYSERVREAIQAKVNEQVDTFNIGIQTGQSEHVDLTVHHPYHSDPSAVASDEDLPQTVNSEIRMNISDDKGQVTVTTAEITHNPSANGDGSGAEVVLHVKTRYGSSVGRDRESVVAEGVEDAKDEMVVEAASGKADESWDSDETDAGWTSDSGHVSPFEDDKQDSKKFKQIIHYEWKRKRAIKGMRGESRNKTKQSDPALESQTEMKSIEPSSNPDNFTELKHGESCPQDEPHHDNEKSNTNDTTTYTDNSQPTQNDDDSLQSESNSQSGCLLRLFSKKFNTLQSQLDKDKDKPLATRTLSDSRESELRDCPDIVACAIEAELKHRDAGEGDPDVEQSVGDLDKVIGLVNMETCSTTM